MHCTRRCLYSLSLSSDYSLQSLPLLILSVVIGSLAIGSLLIVSLVIVFVVTLSRHSIQSSQSIVHVIVSLVITLSSPCLYSLWSLAL